MMTAPIKQSGGGKGVWGDPWIVKSHTNPAKEYRVAQKLTDGSWGCDCQHWKFSKAPKPDCKHILQVKQDETQTYVPANIPVAVPNLKPFGFTEKERKRNESRPFVPAPAPVAAPAPVFLLQTRRVIYVD